MQDKWIEIARTGTFTDSSGRSQTFTDADLCAIANSYNPDKRDCPLTFGHPKTDAAPAFGWASKIKAENGKLFAQFACVPDKVKEVVAKGHYRHVSMSLMPDRVTLRHVALLGAAQPAIDCLKAVELHHADDAITINFSNEENAMPEDLQREIGALKERVASLEKENAALKEQAKSSKEVKEKAEGEKKAAEEKAEKTAAEFAAYRGKVETEKREQRISALVASGKITPAEKAGVLQFAAALAKQDGVFDFASQNGTEKLTLEEKYLAELEARPSDLRNMEFAAQPRPDQTQEAVPQDLTFKL